MWSYPSLFQYQQNRQEPRLLLIERPRPAPLVVPDVGIFQRLDQIRRKRDVGISGPPSLSDMYICISISIPTSSSFLFLV